MSEVTPQESDGLLSRFLGNTLEAATQRLILSMLAVFAGLALIIRIF